MPLDSDRPWIAIDRAWQHATIVQCDRGQRTPYRGPPWSRAALVWFAIVLLALGSGVFREAFLIPRIGHAAGLRMIGIALSVVIVLEAYLTLPWMAPRRRWELLLIGSGWLALTVGIEFALGWWERKPLPVIPEPHTFADGNIRPVILLVTALAPSIASAMQHDGVSVRSPWRPNRRGSIWRPKMHKILASASDIIAVELSYRITSADLDLIMDRLDQVIAAHNKVHVFVEIHAIDGVELSSLAPFTARATALLAKLNRFGRVAVVADQAWIRAGMRVESALLPFVSYRVFPPAETDRAFAWVTGAADPG